VPNDYPQVVDQSTLTGVFQADQFMAIGVEGQKLAGGTAAVATPVIVKDGGSADTYFGVGSSLALLCRSILGRGVNYVLAVASASAATPTLPQRQAAWAPLEDDPTVRIRLTDSTTQADLVALADSCEWAEGIQHKQFCVVGMPAATSKANLIAAAGAVASKRAVLVGPTIYDTNGALLNGAFGAAWAAAEIAKNPDIVDSMNLATIPATTGIEKDATTGLPIFRLRAGAGTPVNDFQDLLTGGVSPFQQDPSGMAAFTHLRMTWITDTTFDALQTLLIKDSVFLGIRDMLLDSRFLRIGNTAQNRAAAAALTDSYLRAHSDWVAPVKLGDGTTGYGVTVVPGVDLKSFTISYFGQVVRGTNVININGTLTIPA
jgi:hypothetical protein